MKEGPFGEKIFPEKKPSVPKKIGRGDPLILPCMAFYAGKQEKLFWFSSLVHIVQFGAVIICRNFVELFWLVRVDWKKKKNDYNCCVSLYEAPTKNFRTFVIHSRNQILGGFDVDKLCPKFLGSSERNFPFNRQTQSFLKCFLKWNICECFRGNRRERVTRIKSWGQKVVKCY